MWLVSLTQRPSRCLWTMVRPSRRRALALAPRATDTWFFILLSYARARVRTAHSCGHGARPRFMSGQSKGETQRAPASGSSDADAASPGSGAILGGVLLVGAAAGYALIAFRFKNMHAGTRGSGSAEVGSGTPRPYALCATSAHAPLTMRTAAALLTPLVRHLCAPLSLRPCRCERRTYSVSKRAAPRKPTGARKHARRPALPRRRPSPLHVTW